MSLISLFHQLTMMCFTKAFNVHATLNLISVILLWLIPNYWVIKTSSTIRPVLCICFINEFKWLTFIPIASTIATLLLVICMHHHNGFKLIMYWIGHAKSTTILVSQSNDITIYIMDLLVIKIYHYDKNSNMIWYSHVYIWELTKYLKKKILLQTNRD